MPYIEVFQDERWPDYQFDIVSTNTEFAVEISEEKLKQIYAALRYYQEAQNILKDLYKELEEKRYG